jgi:hypothetical protein
MSLPAEFFLSLEINFHDMHKKSFLIVALIFLVVGCAFGQMNKAIIVFPEKEVNLGNFKETDPVQVHHFEFVNQGKTPLIINQIKTSCGCVEAEWPKEPILPGKKGVVKVSFDPKGQSGSFSRAIVVHSNADTPMVTLVVNGVVIPVMQMAEVYKYVIGKIKLESIYVSFGEIFKGQTEKQTVRVMNTSDSIPAQLTFRKLPAYIKVRFVPEVLEPGSEGVIEMEFSSNLVNSWDYVVDRLELLINGQPAANNRINVTANIKEDFSGYTAEELANAAQVAFDSDTYDFGSLQDKDVVEHSFILTNKGKTNLYIRKISASCGCTAVQPSKTVIQPGDTTAIKAIYRAAGHEGVQKKAITVITNDPKKSKMLLWIQANVQKTANKP